MKLYAVRFSFTDRRLGPGVFRSFPIHASNFPGAIAKASRRFWKESDTKQRNDIRRGGLKVDVRLVPTQPTDDPA